MENTTSNPAVNSNMARPVRKKRPVLWFFVGCVGLFVVLAVGAGVGFVVAKWDVIQTWYHEQFGTGETGDNGSNFEGAISIKEGEDFNIETAVTEAVERVSPAVVSIAKTNVSLGQGGVSEDQSAIGTGFVIDAEEGIVLTNMHVVNDLNEDYTVVTMSGDSFNVTKIYGDDAYDLALLDVDFGDTAAAEAGSSTVAAVEFGDSDLLKVGEAVIAIGNPLGSFPGTVTQGVVSGLARQVEAGDAYGANVRVYDDVIQTDAAINPGNSGGPLLNLEGQVIGVNFGTVTGSGTEGISFAIPINLVKERVNIFNQNGYFPRPYIGVSYSMVDDITAAMYQVPTGAFVESVVKGSPAEDGGVKKGDIITEIDGNAVDTSLTSMLQEYEIGDKVTLRIWRMDRAGDGTYVELEVTLADGGALD